MIMMSVQEYLTSHNIDRSDVGPFLLIHTVLSAILVGSTWGICYFAGRHSPPQYFLPGNDQLPTSVLLNSMTKMPWLSHGVKRKACQAFSSLEQASRNNRAVQYIEQKIPSVDATLFCVSYAEAKFGRLFFKPITVPGRIWMSMELTRAWKRVKSHHNDGTLASGKTKKKKVLKQSIFMGAKDNAIFSRQFGGVGVSSSPKLQRS